MSDQPTLPQRLNDDRPLLRFTDDLDLWHLGHIANAVDAGQLEPVEPVGTLTVKAERTLAADGGWLTLPPGEYLIVEADDEPAPHDREAVDE